MKFTEVIHPWLARRSNETGVLFLHDSLAVAAQISETAALEIISGQREPDWTEIQQIAGAFGVTVIELLSSIEPPSKNDGHVWHKKQVGNGFRGSIGKAGQCAEPGAAYVPKPKPPTVKPGVLARWMEATGKTQSDVSRESGILPGTVAPHYHRRNNITLPLAEKYAACFGVSLAEFIAGPGKEPEAEEREAEAGPADKYRRLLPDYDAFTTSFPVKGDDNKWRQ